ncbi:death domain-associated protein 6 [Brachionichthys hirsutus]|uniref:death domain-associated protein 6 n=1 Tax=Brachionichthys hirsutus TaxID=412623 RepID=UPI0036049B76
MAVAPASMADQIIVLDDGDEEKTSKPSCSPSTPWSQPGAKSVSTKKDTHVLQAENNRLFAEFVEHCAAFTQDCPDVLLFLQTKYSKASPDYLSSVAFRNTLSSCLSRAQENCSKTFVYINELCTALRQHSTKRKQVVVMVEHVPRAAVSSSLQSPPVASTNKDEPDAERDGQNPAAEENQPSTSGLQGGRKDEAEPHAQKRANRKSRKQIAYLENLLKTYNDEIHRLQRSELSVADLASNESPYIQENQLKRKMMKIYETLCELKGCSTLTGRVIEQRIPYSGTRYPEINRKIERFINGAEARSNPPDYQDILQQVVRANDRHALLLTRKQMNQLAKEVFGYVGTCLQDRRHQDMVYNFGSHLTDAYDPASDPARKDASLQRKLKSNREVAVTQLEEVITKYAVQQEDSEPDRSKRQQKNKKQEEEGHKSEKEEEEVEDDNEEEEEEEGEEEDEEDDSSEPDIEEELMASTQQDGPDDEDEDAAGDVAEQTGEDAGQEEPPGEPESVSVQRGDGLEEDEPEPPTNGLGPLSDESSSDISPLCDVPSTAHSASQSEPTQTADRDPLSNGSLGELPKPVEPHDNGVATTAADGAPASPLAATPPNGTPMPGWSGTLRSQKRKRGEVASGNPSDSECTIVCDSEVGVPRGAGVANSSPPQGESTRANTPAQVLITSSPSTPPPKKNKVNVATQYDPQVIIVLSDSE